MAVLYKYNNQNKGGIAMGKICVNKFFKVPLYLCTLSIALITLAGVKLGTFKIGFSEACLLLGICVVAIGFLSHITDYIKRPEIIEKEENREKIKNSLIFFTFLGAFIVIIPGLVNLAKTIF